jgi:autotransporter-associated beta strand protein
MHLGTLQRLSMFVITATLARALAATAQTYTWVGPAGNVWQNPGVWSPIGVPGASNDVIFTDTGAGVVNLAVSADAHSLTFNTTTGSYGLLCLPPLNETFFGLTAVTVAATDTAGQGINLNGNGFGTLAFPGTGPGALTITNNSIVTGNPTLVISSRGIGTTGDSTAGITFAGAGYTKFDTPFIGAGGTSNQVTGGMTKTGPGTLLLTSGSAGLQGLVTLGGGTTVLDYTGDTSTKLGIGGAGALVGLDLSGGLLSLTANASANVTQSVGTGSVAGTAIDTAHTDIRFTPNGTGTVTLNLTSLLRFAGSTLDVSPQTGFNVQTSTTLTNGILGGWATTGGGSSWATTSGNNFVGLGAGTANVYASGTNTDVGFSSFVNGTTNSLRYIASGLTTYLNGTLTLQSGGILVPYSGFGATIEGGDNTLASSSGTGELIVHAYGDLTINNCVRSASGGLTKTGSGTLTLSGYASANNGTININEGNLRISSGYALNSLSTIRLNDNRYGYNQSLIFQLPDGQNAVTSALILPRGAYVADYYFPTTLDNEAESSRITLNGAIGYTPGVNTPILFTGVPDNCSGFTLTGTNPFTAGSVRLNHGFLGINSNAALGNTANNLLLAVSSDSAGGLELLGNGIDLARPVSVITTTRVLNYGANVDTISGAITGNGRLVKDGSGTLVLTGTNSVFGIQTNAGTVSVASAAKLGSGSLYLAGGTLAFTGSTAFAGSVYLGPVNGAGTGAIDVASGQMVMFAGAVANNAAVGALMKSGGGTLSLTYTGNNYSGGTTIQQGVLQVAGDGSLGSASGMVTIGPLGTLTYAPTANATTGRTFSINGGTLTVTANQMLTFNGATIGGGFLRGPGTFAVTGGSTFTGTSTPTSTVLTVTGTGSFANFSNGGTLSISAASSSPTVFAGVINQGSGTITVGASSQLTVSDFQTYGTLTINPATITENFSQTTLMANIGTTQLFFNGGSRTFVGTPSTAVYPSNWPDTSLRGQPTFVAGIDLNGKNATVAGGLFVNNGYVEDSTNGGSGTATIVSDFGSLVKGAGFFQNSVQTINGGKFQAGNSPGMASFGKFVLGPGGVSSYVFAIDDATGAAGPSPDALGHVSGWGLVKAISEAIGAGTTPGDFTWTATPADKLLVSIDTLLNPTTVGTDVPGLMDHFDRNQSYAWPAVMWTCSYAGPADDATLEASTAFDTSGFVNPIGGRFGWDLDAAGHMLSLTYTPTTVPEPSGLVLSGLVAGGSVIIRRWRRRRTTRVVPPARQTIDDFRPS